MTMERIIEKIRDNDVVLWIGSGFSLYAGMPRAGEIKNELLNKCDEEEKKELSEIQDLAQFCQAFVNMRSGSKNELLTVLQALIDITPKSLEYHKLLSEVPQIDTIITTNYDRLFELAYGSGNLVPIVQNTNFPYVQSEKVKLYKVHGDIYQQDSVLITQDDYNEFFHNINNPLWNKIKTLVAEKTIVFIGFSYADQNIDFLIDSVARNLGTHMKESFLLTPNMATHRQQALAARKIKFIPMTGEDFVEHLHKEIKKKIIFDMVKGSVNAQKGSALLEEWGVSLGFSLIDGKLNMEELRAIGKEGMELSLSLKNFNLLEAMNKNPYEIITIDNSQILSINSSYKDIELPFAESLSATIIKIIPVPHMEFKADISIPFTDILIENIQCKSYGNQEVELIRFEHKFFNFEFNLKELKVNYKVNEKIKSVRQAKLIFGFLNALVNTDAGILLIPHVSGKTNVPTDEIPISFNIKEKGNTQQQKEIGYIFELLKKFNLVEDFYKVKFERFHYNLNKDESLALSLLVANIVNKPSSFEKLHSSIVIDDIDHFENKVLNKDNLIRIEYQKEVTLQIFEKQILIKDRKLTITINKAYVINKKEVKKQLKKRQKNLSISFGSRDNSIFYQFEPLTSTKSRGK